MQRQRRRSNLFWDLTRGGEPMPTDDELGEIARAVEDPALEVRPELRLVVKLIRLDTERLNAALADSDDRREKERARKAAYRARTSQLSRNVPSVPDGTERDRMGQTGHDGTNGTQDVPDVPPTHSPTHTLTHSQTERTERDSPGDRRRFQPPSVAEVAAYIREKGYRFDAEAFCAFYESKGWRVGDQPMKSWQGACVTWERRRIEEGARRPPDHNHIRTATAEEYARGLDV